MAQGNARSVDDTETAKMNTRGVKIRVEAVPETLWWSRETEN